MRNFSGSNLNIVNSNGEIVGIIKNGEDLKVYKDPFGTTVRANISRLYKAIRKDPAIAYPLIVLMARLMPKTNILQYRGENYNSEMFAKELNISQPMASRYMTRLKNLNLLKKITYNKQRVYALNPDWIRRSRRIDPTIIREFRYGG